MWNKKVNWVKRVPWVHHSGKQIHSLSVCVWLCVCVCSSSYMPEAAQRCPASCLCPNQTANSFKSHVSNMGSRASVRWHVLAYSMWMHNVAATSWWWALTSQMFLNKNTFYCFASLRSPQSPFAPLQRRYDNKSAAACDSLISVCPSPCVRGCVQTFYSSFQKRTDEQLPHKLLSTSVNASCHLQRCNDHENCDLDLWKAVMWLNGLLPRALSSASELGGTLQDGSVEDCLGVIKCQ